MKHRKRTIYDTEENIQLSITSICTTSFHHISTTNF